MTEALTRDCVDEHDESLNRLWRAPLLIKVKCNRRRGCPQKDPNFLLIAASKWTATSPQLLQSTVKLGGANKPLQLRPRLGV